MSARPRSRLSAFALALPLVLAASDGARAAEPVYVGSIREGLTAPMSLDVHGNQIAVLEPYTRQIVLYSADGFEQRRLDIDARARALARLRPSVYLFCDRGRASVRAVDVGTGAAWTFLTAAGDPVDVVVDGERCYVLDGRGRVVVTDLAGAVQREIPLVRPGGGTLIAPAALARDATRDRLYVLDQVASSVTSFAGDGTHLGTFGSFGAGVGEVTRGGEIACDLDGYLYVSDRYQGRVTVFDAAGNFVCNIDPIDLGAERMAVPTGIAVDAQGLLYVASTESRRIQLFYLDHEASADVLLARPLYPTDQAGVTCDDLLLVALIERPADAPRPSGADFRLLRGGDLSELVAEASNVPVSEEEPGGGADSVTAEWRPELDCTEATLFAWQVRGRSIDEVGPWSPLQWFVAEPSRPIFQLGRNYPNPFHPRTAIPFQVPAGAEARLRVLDLHGREVWASHLRDSSGGFNEVVWDGRNQEGRRVAAGVYFYQLSADGFIATRKMVLLR
jgi:DNA-binding beta-propeller fold protein YncE